MFAEREFQKVLGKAKDIVWQEQGNSHTIYLYYVGSYWVAFEKSAYLLHCLTERYNLSVINAEGVPFPLIMMYIADSELAVLSGNMDVEEDRDGYKALSTGLSSSGYNRWYRTVMDG